MAAKGLGPGDLAPGPRPFLKRDQRSREISVGRDDDAVRLHHIVSAGEVDVGLLSSLALPCEVADRTDGRTR